jgi:uncharacterized repeat protein (TIGR01451 family)
LCAVVLTALLVAVGLLLRPTLAAPRAQEDMAELAIVKTVDGEEDIAPGQSVRFTVLVTNTGTVTATSVTVHDDYDQAALPAIEVVSESDLGSAGARNDGDVIAWQLGDLPPGGAWSATYEATAAGAFEAGTAEVTNIASVQADNVEGAVEATVVLTVRAPQLTLTLERERVDGEGEVAPGDTLCYTIRYGNNGTADATNLVIEATFDETVVQQIDNVTTEGQLDGAAVRWSLGTVPAQASGEVSCDVTLKSTLSEGDVEVTGWATMSADEVETASASDSFILRTPLLTIGRQREDLNGRPIEPGDALRFTIRVRNSGTVAASGVVVRDDFDEGVVAEVSEISGGGAEKEGAVEWSLTDPLEPDTEQTLSYKVRLRSGIDETIEAVNIAAISIEGVELDRAQTTMTIEPVAQQAGGVQTGSSLLLREKTIPIIVLVGVSAVTALLAMGGLALLILRKGQWKSQYFRLVIEGVAVVVIVEAVLVLAMSEGIESNGAVSILSGIAGYVLGRTIAEEGSSKKD